MASHGGQLRRRLFMSTLWCHHHQQDQDRSGGRNCLTPSVFSLHLVIYVWCCYSREVLPCSSGWHGKVRQKYGGGIQDFPHTVHNDVFLNMKHLSLLYLLQYCFCFRFSGFGPEAWAFLSSLTRGRTWYLLHLKAKWWEVPITSLS